jgi:hypothetical protein
LGQTFTMRAASVHNPFVFFELRRHMHKFWTTLEHYRNDSREFRW